MQLASHVSDGMATKLNASSRGVFAGLSVFFGRR